METLTELKVRDLEERLRLAMLRSNTVELDKLIHEDLLFVGPLGAVYSKAQDLENHRSGVQRMQTVEWQEIAVRLHASVAITCVSAYLAGSFHEQPFEGQFRYIRAWVNTGTDWQIIGGSMAPVVSQS